MDNDKDKIIENLMKNGKKISADDLIQMDLTEDEYMELLEELEKKGISVDDDVKEPENLSFGISSAVNMYLKEIQQIPALSASEENRLFKMVMMDDEEAKKRIVESNLKFVVFFAKRYVRPGVSMLDLIQEGNLGLMEAVEKFDVFKSSNEGYKFSSHAAWYIKGRMFNFINHTKGIRRRDSELKIKIKKYIDTYLLENGKQPTADEISKALDVNVYKIKELLVSDIKSTVVSLDAELGEDSESTLQNFVPSDANVEKTIEEKVDHETVLKLMSCLNNEENLIISLRFGFLNGKCYTLEEIGKLLGKTREGIRQREARALQKLKIESKKPQYKVYQLKNYMR